MDDLDTFESADAGASKTTPIQAGAIKKSTMVLLKGYPCKVVETSTSKTGKHGHAKVSIVGLDIFTGKKHEDMCPSTHNMEEVVAKRKEFQLVDIKDDGFVTLMNDDGETRDDLRMPSEAFPEAHKKITNGFEAGNTMMVTVLSAMGKEAIIDAKEA